MPKLLLASGQKGWPYFQRLLIAQLRFLEPYLRNAELTDAVRLLYKASHCATVVPMQCVAMAPRLPPDMGCNATFSAIAGRLH